jgi:hypothetical protein
MRGLPDRTVGYIRTRFLYPHHSNGLERSPPILLNAKSAIASPKCETKRRIALRITKPHRVRARQCRAPTKGAKFRDECSTFNTLQTSSSQFPSASYVLGKPLQVAPPIPKNQ